MSIDLATLDMSVRPWLPCGTSGRWSVQRRKGEESVTCLVEHDGDHLRHWMVDDGEEQDANRPCVEQAHGHVLLTGLGLGMLPNALFASGRVESVDIVERSHDVITLVWRHLRARWPVKCAQDRLNLIVGDAAKPEVWRRGRTWDVAWHDFTVDPMTDEQAAKVYADYAPFCGQQDHWRGAK